MSKKQFIKRYSLIINKLRKNASSFEEIQKYLQQQSELDEEKYEISIRTFQREIKEVRIVFTGTREGCCDDPPDLGHINDARHPSGSWGGVVQIVWQSRAEISGAFLC